MTKERIKLNDHFTYKKLIRFTLPSIAMMIFTSIYGVVDGFFVSNYVGKTSFAAVNLIWPFIMMISSIGFMFGTGGSALVATTMGEGDKKRANTQFSFLVYFSLILSVVISALSFIFLPYIASLMGAKGVLLDDCVLYGRILTLTVPFYVMQFEFQSFFVSGEKPKLGLYMTIFSGVTNIVFDALFIAVLDFGLVGAAVATSMSQLVGGVFPLIYFSRKNNSLLRFCKTEFNFFALYRTCYNGISELLSNISMSFVSMLYNIQLMKYVGEDGVAAYGVLMYVNLIFLSLFIGYCIGTAPIVSYNYGSQNHDELKGIFKKSITILSFSSVSMFVLAILLSRSLSQLFVGYDKELFSLTVRAFFLFSFSFLFASIPMFGSAFFTALNNGLVSAIISVLRTVVFQVTFVLVLPLLFRVDGIFVSIACAELCAFLISVIMFATNKKKYNY